MKDLDVAPFTDRQSPSPILVIKLFGVFDYRNGEDVFIPLKSRKAEALLLCLALSGSSGFEREHLSRILWPDLPEKSAKAGLRQAVARVRRMLGAVFVEPKTGWIALSEECISCDYWNLVSGSGSSEILEWPTEPFLVNYPEPSDLFSEWLERTRMSKKAELKSIAIRKLTDQSVLESQKSGYAQMLLLLDHVDENSVQAVLEHLKNSGRAQHYITVLESYKTRLKSQYDLQPSPEFTSQYDNTPAVNIADEKVGPVITTQKQTFGRPTLTVKTFDVHGSDDEHDFLGIGLTEEIVARLSSQNWFSVNTSASSILYRPPSVGYQRPEYLHNSYSVNGTIYTHQDFIRISVRLRDDLSEQVKWSRTYHTNMGDFFTLQEEIVASISEVLASNIISAEASAANDFSTELSRDIWVRTMKARYLFWRMNKINNAKARELLDDVIMRSETPSVPAFVVSTFIRMLDVWSLWSSNPKNDVSEAVSLAERSTRLYPSDPWSYFTLGTALGLVDKLELSIEAFNRSLTFNSNFAPAIGAKGKYQLFLGRLDKAKKNLSTAIQLNDMDTHYGLWQNAMGIVLYMQEEYKEALKWSDRAISTNRFWAHNHLLSAACLQQLNRAADAKEAFAYSQKYLPEMSAKNLHYAFPFQSKELRNQFFEPLLQLGLLRL